jgi:hypothetical protein
MATSDGFTAYKGYRLYHPDGDDFRKDHNGRYAVVCLIRKDGETYIHRIAIPFAYGWTVEDALEQSLTHGRRLVNNGLIPNAPLPKGHAE